MAVCTYPGESAALGQCRELIHNHGRIFVQQGAWVHDRSKDAQRVEAIFATQTAQCVARDGLQSERASTKVC